jgi:predicted cupin superfamily sugar epimerase
MIHVLLVAGQYSRWHRITSDKVWQNHESEYILVGYTVALGFESEDSSLAAIGPEDEELMRPWFPDFATPIWTSQPCTARELPALSENPALTSNTR